MIRFDFVLWEKFKGHPDRNIEALALMKHELFQAEIMIERCQYYFFHEKEMVDKFGALLMKYVFDYAYIKESIRSNGYAECMRILTENARGINNAIYDFVRNCDPEEKAKLTAILDAEEHGRKWVDIEVRCGKAKERFPEHYKSYIEMVEFINGRNYNKYKYECFYQEKENQT